jgi:hypothetical protein
MNEGDEDDGIGSMGFIYIKEIERLKKRKNKTILTA